MNESISRLSSNVQEQRRQALSTWDGEGGAGPLGSQEESAYEAAEREAPPLTHAEMVGLRVRVVALENLIIALLSGASDQQNERALDMAASMSRRSGIFAHPLTHRAAVYMTDIVDRARCFRP